MSDIHDAIEERDRDRVNAILHSDSSLIHSQDGLGNCPLHIAAYTGQSELAELLLGYGADVNARGDMKRTPLHYAAIEREPAVAEVLVKHSADLAPVDSHGNTPLYYSVQGEYVPSEVAKVLLKHGTPVDMNSAVWLMSSEQLWQTLESNPDALKTAAQPERLVVDAVIKGDPNSLVALLQHAAPVNGTVSARPLILALPRLDILQLLLDHGADPAVTDSFGENVVTKAKMSGASNDVLNLLQKYSVQH